MNVLKALIGVYFKVGELKPERELNDVLAGANRV